MLKYIKEIFSRLILSILRKVMVPRLFTSHPRKPYCGENIFILHHNSSPTLYYYFISRINLYQAHNNVVIIDTSNQKIENYRIFDGSTIIIVRYVPLHILLSIRKRRYINIIYFIDDNIPAAFTDLTLPSTYALKLTFQFYSIRYFLSKMRTSIFFSTPIIYNYYKKHKGKILRPLNIYKNQITTKKYSICYFGVSSHTKEYDFIASIAQTIQKKTNNIYFFIVDSRYTRKLFNKIPRVYFIGVSKMPDYISFLEYSHFDIGLSPLFMDTIWNSSKSHIKIFDISASCRYGIFSKNEIYYPFAKQYSNFFFLENIQSIWIKKIFEITNSSSV